jgi:hypothetical protein
VTQAATSPPYSRLVGASSIMSGQVTRHAGKL